MKTYLTIAVLTLGACAAEMTDEAVEVGLVADELTVTPATNKINANLGANVSLGLQVAEVIVNRWGGTPSNWICSVANNTNAWCNRSNWTVTVGSRLTCANGGFDYLVAIGDSDPVSIVYVRSMTTAAPGPGSRAWNVNSSVSSPRCRPFSEGASLFRASMNDTGSAARLVYP
jgi:hypothetical protein